jgi:hypothetical protein
MGMPLWVSVTERAGFFAGENPTSRFRLTITSTRPGHYVLLLTQTVHNARLRAQTSFCTIARPRRAAAPCPPLAGFHLISTMWPGIGAHSSCAPALGATAAAAGILARSSCGRDPVHLALYGDAHDVAVRLDVRLVRLPAMSMEYTELTASSWSPPRTFPVQPDGVEAVLSRLRLRGSVLNLCDVLHGLCSLPVRPA